MTKPRYRLKASGELIAMDGFGEVVSAQDGFSNQVSALGFANAKIQANTYANMNVGDNPMFLDAIYDGSTWYSKILEIPADDATREWRSWKGTSEQISAIENTEKALQVASKVRDAIIMARHRGGSVIVVGGLPGMSGSELNLDRIQKGDVKFLNVLSRDQIHPIGIILDPYSKYYGMPEKWQLRSEGGSTKYIHPSRVGFIPGPKSPGRNSLYREVWGRPLWNQLADSIEAADGGASIVTALMHEAVVDVVRTPNFIQGLAAKDAEAIHTKRWSMAKSLKSIGSILLLDKEDEWDQKQVVWNGLPEVVQLLLTIMAGAADIPVTRLIGRSASGMNATGEGDLRNHYDNIKAMQVLEFGPALAPLDEILMRTTFGSQPKDLWYQWKPLWQPSEKEMAETDRFEANAIAIISKLNLVPVKALEKVVQNRMIESGRYPGLEKALIQFPETEPVAVVDPNAPADPNSHQVAGGATGVAGQRANRGNGTVNAVDSAPRTLYVRRDVLNVEDIAKWAESQGFTDIVPDLHVTIAYSLAPVDWFAVGTSYSDRLEMPAGGPRQMDRLGPTGKYIALLITANELVWRNMEIREAGASWNWPDYQPHISIQIGGNVDLSKVTPYQGKIILGPEIFEEVRVSE